MAVAVLGHPAGPGQMGFPGAVGPFRFTLRIETGRSISSIRMIEPPGKKKFKA
jgi:hypothetical protein